MAGCKRLWCLLSTILDFKQCFDSVKTPVGLTDRKEVKKIVAQGEPPSSLKCTVTVDSISQAHTENLSDHLYLYRGLVPVPPLGMVDDQVGISHCGLDSALSTAHLNAQANIKKLQFGASKCHQIHIGKNKIVCPENTIDSWIVEKGHEGAKTILDFIDIEGEPHIMEAVNEDCYLGDILQSDGKNVKNIEERYKRGMGAVKQVLSSLLSNSESWYNLTQKDVSKPSKSDWITTVMNDLKILEINLSFDDIKNTTKTMFKQLVKQRIKIKAFQFLISLQENHSKSKELKYQELQLQSYLRSGNRLSIKEKAFIFSARSRMIDIKSNF